MKSRQRSPIWPYLAILACLFALSVTAPRAWNRVAQRSRPPKVPAASSPVVAPPMVAVAKERVVEAPLEPLDESELRERDSFCLEQEAPQVASTLATPPAEPVGADAVENPKPQNAEATAPPMPSQAASVPESTATDAPEQRTGSLPEADGQQAPEADPSPLAAPAEPEPPRYAWPLPRALMGQLHALASGGIEAEWALAAAGLIERICRDGSSAGDLALDTLGQLRTLTEPERIVSVADSVRQSRLVRTRYALTRWIDVWEQAARLEALPAAGAPTGDDSITTARLEAVNDLLRRRANGAGWRKYLKLEAVSLLARPQASGTERRQVARSVLDRMTSFRLTKKQREFLAQPPLVELADALRVWAGREVAAKEALEHLEAYEHSRLASDGRLVAEDFQSLHWSTATAARQLGHSLDTHYLNANLRVSVAVDLANQLLPQPGTMVGPINERIVNVPVIGRSTTFTELKTVFVPDARRIRIGLEAHGLVDSSTRSTKGPATFYNRGQATFVVQKLLVLGPQGLVVWPAVAEAESNYSYLTSLETNFDGVPVVGPIVRSIARSQIEESRGQATFESEYKLARRAREQVEGEMRPLIADAARRFEDQQLATLKGLGLELVPLSLATSEERIVARARLGGIDQIGAHTPRPRAPSDSWLSVQFHESALNNALAKLDLNGRTFTLPELFAWLSEKLNRPALAKQDDLPDDVQMTFADQDAVRVRCEDGRARVTFAFAHLAHRGRSWRNFTVETSYLPEALQLEPRFIRGRELHFDGRSVKGKAVVLLRTIFSKVLSPSRDISLLPQSLTSDQRLANLEITQFAVEDGWIGLAYSPRRGPGHVARRPK